MKMDENFIYNITDAYNTQYILPYGKYEFQYLQIDDLYENIKNILVNCHNNEYIYSGYNWNINNIITKENSINCYPIYIYTNYTDIIPYDNKKIIIRIPYDYYQNDTNIKKLVIFEFFEALLYMGYYNKIYNSPNINSKINFIKYNLKFIHKEDYNIIKQVKTLDKFNTLYELVTSDYVTDLLHIKDLLYSKYMLYHILYNKCIDNIYFSDICNTYIQQQVGYNIQSINDYINEKINDYIAKTGKILLINWEEYNTIPLIQIGNEE